MEPVYGTVAKSEVERLEAADLVARIQENNPSLSEKVNEKRLSRIVKETLKALAQDVNERQEGQVAVRGLGKISIREVERIKDGEFINVKKVTLKPARPKVQE